MDLDKQYWSARYRDGSTGWDVGEVSRPIKEYIDQLPVSESKILIPGCGNCYEGEYLWKRGLKNVYFLDFSEEPLKNLKARCPEIPDNNLICGNFFDLEGKFDLIIEQTLFCALDPSLRENYARKIASLISPIGKLIGVMFDKELEGGPPFGGSRTEYLTLFSKYFNNVSIEPCYNSIEKRVGAEVFVKLS